MYPLKEIIQSNILALMQNLFKPFIMKYCFFILITIMLSCKGQKKNEMDADQNYKTAFNVLYDTEKDDYEVFTMDLDGNNYTNISNSPGVDWTYKAHEGKVYFVSDRDTSHRSYFLHSWDAKTGLIKRISQFKLRDSWFGVRENGNEIVVAPRREIDSSGFVIIDNSGHVVERIKIDLPAYSDPEFSPDGKKIVFRGGSSASKRDENYLEEIYIINRDGQEMKRLSHYPPADTTAPWFAYKAGPPQWNKTENFISFQSFREGKYKIYAVTPDGSRQWKLLDTDINEGWHSWSEDGKYMAMEVFDDSQSQFNIALVDWPSKNYQVITDSTFRYQQAPAIFKTNDR